MDITKKAQQFGRTYPEDAVFVLAHPDMMDRIPQMCATYAAHMSEKARFGFSTQTAYQHIYEEGCVHCQNHF